jgi:hypothetical protein
MLCGAAQRHGLNLGAPASRVCASAHKRTPGARRAAEIVTVLVLVSLTRAAVASEPAFSFRNPFHPEQCDRAVRFAQKRLAENASNRRARFILAEGRLCQGLKDNPWELDKAIDMLRQIVADEPRNFFAQLELADALRKRYPASAEAHTVLLRARDLLNAVELGRARADLAEYVAENAAAIAGQRSRILSLVREYEADFTAGRLQPPHMAALLLALEQTGGSGVERAERYLEVYLMQHDDIALRTLYSAELMRGRSPPARCRDLYADAVSALCAAQPSSDCSLAQWRLTQLDQRLANPIGAPPVLQRTARKEE